jgi:thioredoxin 1
MKTTIVIMTFLFLVGYATKATASEHESDTSHGLSFHEGSLDEALQKAKDENKLIFLDIYASWCGSCRRLKENTFTDRQAGDLYNANFINMALDGEKGEGKILAQKYGVKAYPTLLFIDHSGRVVAEVNGFHNPRRFVELGERVLKQR